MSWPVPNNVDLSTPYGKRGSSWSCNRDSSGKGIHTGADFACPVGTPVYATIAGEVRHRNYGSAFGNHQVAISPDPGQPFADGEVFYAHMRSRVANGTRVKPGDKIGEVGTEGNVTGPHLHYEFHPKSKGKWNCSVVADPAPTLSRDSVTGGKVYLSKLVYGQQDSDSVRRLQEVLNGHTLVGGSTLSVTGNYATKTDNEVRLCQQQHGYGNDPAKGSSVGPKQADHLFKGTGHTIVNDLPQEPTDPEEPPVSGKRFIYKFGGKPSGTQAIGTSYGVVSQSSFTPPGDGFLLSMLYLNAAHSFKSGVNEAGFRVRSVREAYKGKAVDYSGYGDFTPNRNLTKPGEFVLTHIWFEMCEAGRPIHWEVDRASAFASFTLGTRYAKWLWISTDVFTAMNRALGSPEAVAETLRAFFDHGDDE